MAHCVPQPNTVRPLALLSIIVKRDDRRKKKGSKPYLTPWEEKAFANYVLQAAERGHPVRIEARVLSASRSRPSNVSVEMVGI
ncbi:hypothetical protein EV356DRAFT_496521 [Viridothelium virens]|uniref:Uncharacterized protein n=1 Tax=Viridothelium virens TaxID=1048519 RepID=A0A6A6GTU8_VIRVR|nr:hypothetical protein EV356DRAFT_496521 [Viridothelium virens]